MNEEPGEQGGNLFLKRIMRVLRFDDSVYREVAADQERNAQAAAMIIRGICAKPD